MEHVGEVGQTQGDGGVAGRQRCALHSQSLAIQRLGLGVAGVAAVVSLLTSVATDLPEVDGAQHRARRHADLAPEQGGPAAQPDHQAFEPAGNVGCHQPATQSN